MNLKYKDFLGNLYLMAEHYLLALPQAPPILIVECGAQFSAADAVAEWTIMA